MVASLDIVAHNNRAFWKPKIKSFAILKIGTLQKSPDRETNALGWFSYKSLHITFNFEVWIKRQTVLEWRNNPIPTLRVYWPGICTCVDFFSRLIVLFSQRIPVLFSINRSIDMKINQGIYFLAKGKNTSS